MRDFTQAGSQRAFEALVTRHVDLVYSAALRQVRVPQLAEDVTQSVFIVLSRNARSLKPGAPLVAWLYLVTRRAAIDLVRAENRRRARETTAMEIAAMNSTSPEWSRMEPLLDDAMETLEERERMAILLRFFEGKSLREVGEALGTSEDAAQKRVSRALEQLRAAFDVRGVALGVGALASTLTAHAVQAAPIGLGLSISSAAALGGTAVHAVAIEATKTIAMTTLQKTVIVAALAAAAGVGIYEQRVIARQEEQLAAALRQTDSLRAELGQLRRERDAATARWAAMEREISEAQTSIARGGQGGAAPGTSGSAELTSALGRVAELKRRIAAMPGSRARASSLLSNEEWLQIALGHKLDTDQDIEAALVDAQNQVTFKWSEAIKIALRDYAAAHGGMMPADSTQLAAFLPSGSDAAMLTRFQLLRTGKLSEVPSDAWLFADTGPVDDETASLVMFGLGNTITSNSANGDQRVAARAFADFLRANGGQPPTEAGQLKAYLRRPLDERILRDFWKQHGHLLR